MCVKAIVLIGVFFLMTVGVRTEAMAQDEALEVYQRALKTVKNETEHQTWQKKAKQRIAEITKADQDTVK